jgi:hypothetical protein
MRSINQYILDKKISVRLNIDPNVIIGDFRNVRVSWTREMVQDLSLYHNIDAEAELTSLLTEQIAAEIDREILTNIRL